MYHRLTGSNPENSVLSGLLATIRPEPKILEEYRDDAHRIWSVMKFYRSLCHRGIRHRISILEAQFQ